MNGFHLYTVNSTLTRQPMADDHQTARRVRQMSRERIRMRELHMPKNIAAASHLLADSTSTHPINNQCEYPESFPVTPTAVWWHSSGVSVPGVKCACWSYFRFFNGESSDFFSPAGATGAFSLTFLSSGVGASFFFEGYNGMLRLALQRKR